MVLISSLGDWILTGGKLIRCTVDRNITCLQEERTREGECLSKKKRESRESRMVIAPPSLCCEEIKEGRRSCVRRKRSRDDSWVVCSAVI